MKIVSWNMGCAPPMSRYRKTHSEAWDYLLGDLRPDVALVQEALRDLPAAAQDFGTAIWNNQAGAQSGTAVLLRHGIEASAMEASVQGSYLASAAVTTDDGGLQLVSVHVGPPNYRKHLRGLAEHLAGYSDGRRFLMAGDLNAARHIDKVYGGKWFTQFFEGLERNGVVDVHWKRHQEEVWSFWGRQAQNRYQCDHVLSDPAVSDPRRMALGPTSRVRRGSLTSRLRYYPQLFGRQKTPPVLSSQRAALVVQLPLVRGLSAR
jgi:hypothetical protein